MSRTELQQELRARGVSAVGTTKKLRASLAYAVIDLLAEENAALRADKQQGVESSFYDTSRVNKQYIASSLAQPFRQREDGLTYLDEMVLGLPDNFQGHNYVTVFQSSGMGKTKWALSLKERDLAHLVYLHIGRIAGGARGNGWPNPKPFPLMEWAFDKRRHTSWRSAVDRMKVMIALTMSRSCTAFVGNGVNVPSRCQGVFSYGKTARYGNVLRGIDESDWRDCKIQDCLREVADFQDVSEKKIIVVWDEAALFSDLIYTVETDGIDPPNVLEGRYTITARPVVVIAIAELADEYVQMQTGKKDLPFGHVFLATTSGARLEDASLSSGDDSMRFLASHGELPPPVTAFMENMDIMMKDSVHQRRGIGAIPRVDTDFVASYGRPLWSTVKPPSTKVSPAETAADFASYKLLGGELMAQATWDNISEEELLAIVMSRIAGFIVPVQEAEQLVRSHMAIAKSVSTTSVTACYGSEPMLAAASKVVSSKLGGYGDAAMIARLKTCFSLSPVNAGDIGEFAAIVVLLKAMDRCCDGSISMAGLFPARPLTTFLDELLGPRWREHVSRALEEHNSFKMQPAAFFDILASTTVSFNHFFRITEQETADWPSTLCAAYRRCAGIICSRGFPVLDLVIPTARTDTDEFSGVHVSVKNTVKPFPPIKDQSDAIMFPFNEAGFLPGLFLGLRMVKGEVVAGRADIIQKSGKHKVEMVGYVASSLLDLPVLSAGEIDSFEELCALHREQDSNRVYSTDGIDPYAVDAVWLLPPGGQ